MDTKGILLWAGFLIILVSGFLYSHRLKTQIRTDGIETEGVISRITDAGGPEETDLHVYARYCTEDGEEVEGILSNPSSDLEEGQKVRLKYHPVHKTNARLVSQKAG